MMTISKKDLEVLQRPFAANEHEFLKGKAYITEGAITDRIETIDPSWTLEQISLFNRAESNQVVCTMRLTINGVHRDGVGMSQITKLKSGDGEANEAEKSAATDALKRAARLFGIGRYLLDLPGYVVDASTMAQYLGQRPQKPVSDPKPAPIPETAQNANLPPPDATAGQSNVIPDANPAWFNKPVGEAWKDLHPYLLEHVYSGNKIGKEKSMQHHADKTGAWAGMTAGDVVTYLKTRHEQKTDVPA